MPKSARVNLLKKSLMEIFIFVQWVHLHSIVAWMTRNSLLETGVRQARISRNKREKDANVKKLLAWNRRCPISHNFVVSNLTKQILFIFYGQLPVYTWSNFLFTKSTDYKASFRQRDLGIIYFYLVIMY